MMTTYARRGPGQTYLKQALLPMVNRVIVWNDDLEINPSKVYEAMVRTLTERDGKCDLPPSVTIEEAAQHPQVVETIRPRVGKIRDWVGLFLDALIASRDKVPYGIRWICKQIMILARVRQVERRVEGKREEGKGRVI